MTDTELRHHLAERDRLFAAMDWSRPEEYESLSAGRAAHAGAALRALKERGGRFDDGAAIWRVAKDGLGIVRHVKAEALTASARNRGNMLALSAAEAAALDRANARRYGAPGRAAS